MRRRKAGGRGKSRPLAEKGPDNVVLDLATLKS